MNEFKTIIDGAETSWNVNYKYYHPSTDTTRKKVSGVYLFSPKETSHKLLESYSSPSTCEVFIGDIVVQVLINWSDQVFTKLTIFNDVSNVKIETLITKPPSRKGEEIVLIVDTDIKNSGTFYTDSNGMEMHKRELNKRENWRWSADEQISGNYYPITSAMYVEDLKTQKRAT